jgi:cell division protein FtsL
LSAGSRVRVASIAEKLLAQRLGAVVKRRDMTSSAAPVYRFFRRASGPASSTRGLAVAMIVIACVCVALGVFRVQRRHEVLRLGYQLERQTERVAELREARRRLELELAALSAPERIRRLATALGMTQVSPDRIRVVQDPHHDKVASEP